MSARFILDRPGIVIRFPVSTAFLRAVAAEQVAGRNPRWRFTFIREGFIEFVYRRSRVRQLPRSAT